MKKLFYMIIVLFFIQIFPVSGMQISEMQNITIGFIPVENATQLQSSAQTFENYLEQYLDGIDVKIVVPTSYEMLIEGLRFGHIDASFMDAGSSWIAHKKTGAEVIFAEVVNGKVNYNATLYTKYEDDTIQNIEDTIGKKVAFTSITGSSGFIVPMGKLLKSNLINDTPNDFVSLEASLSNIFANYTFAGGYKAALKLLVNGNVDAAFSSDTAPQNFLTIEEQNKIKVAEIIGSVPSHTFVVSSNLPNNIVQKLSNALISLNYEANNNILNNIYGADALVPTTTKMHISEFGEYIDTLVGIEDKILNR